MAEKKREELINDIIDKSGYVEGSEDAYKSFLEALSIEELQSHYDSILEEE